MRMTLLRLLLLPLFLLAGSCTTISTAQAPDTKEQAFVIAANPLAARAGMEVLERGGSAVDAAIAVIQASGLRYEVHGMGTVNEGPPEKIWPLMQAVHQATHESGAERTLSLIKASGAALAGGPRVEDLVRKFRKP